MADAPRRPVALLERVERFLDSMIPPADEVVQLVKRGETLLALGDPTGALHKAQNALAAAPMYLPAVALRAEALFSQGESAHAMGVLLDASRERAIPSALLARACEYAAHHGDVSRALEFATLARGRAVGTERESALRLQRAAERLESHGQRAAALQIARGATVMDPELGSAWLILAKDAVFRGDLAQGRRALERASTSIGPADRLANRNAGELALGLGEHKLATRHLRRAWLVGDQEAVAPLVLSLWRSGDEEALERVVSDAEGAQAQLARALTKLGQSGERPTALESIRADEIPDTLWPLALAAALRAAPEVASRWAEQAPERHGSAAILALAQSQRWIDARDGRRAREALMPAIEDEQTRAYALTQYESACACSWQDNLPQMLEELAVMLSDEPSLATVVAELRARRRELDEPLRVAILGEFSAGKSTFLNAMVGAKVSPMGVLPTTAQVHWLRYGDPSARVVDRSGSVLYCTIDEAPRQVAKTRESGGEIAYVEVTWPAARLARIELIDTPGFNAGDASHERAVRSAFAMADVGLWLFDARQAGKASETEPIDEAQQAGVVVLGVLNKIDQLQGDQLREVVQLLSESFGQSAPLVMSVSSREALNAQLALEDSALSESDRQRAKIALAASGFASLFAWMDEQLVAQRSEWKQRRVAWRARAWVTQAQQALAQTEREANAREACRDALGTAMMGLRNRLPDVLTATRQQVTRMLHEQLTLLQRNERGGTSSQDTQVLRADAAAEIAWRVRQHALSELAPALQELERLSVEAGLLVSESSQLASALVIAAIERAAADGARDTVGPATSFVTVWSDAFAPLELALSSLERRESRQSSLLLVALEVANRLLLAQPTPTVTTLQARATPSAKTEG
ncbi:MAG: dynamin family protein [Deltaproteobacteria bacterium]|nr:dynamin family protein [Deltaproteobacteria bacterium]